MKVLKILLGAVVAIALAVGALFLGARFADGPVGMIPGGPLEAGAAAAGPVADWTFAADIETIELQLEGDATSRTTWILVRDGVGYIPCSLGFPPGKSWHHRADRNGAALVRVSGTKYRVDLARVENPALADNLKEIAGAKYGAGPPTDAGVWFFEMRPRA